MSTLAEIEQAVETLPPSEQEALLEFLTYRVGRKSSAEPATDDPFDAMIGAFAGPREATGRRAEDILYGRGE